MLIIVRRLYFRQPVMGDYGIPQQGNVPKARRPTVLNAVPLTHTTGPAYRNVSLWMGLSFLKFLPSKPSLRCDTNANTLLRDKRRYRAKKKKKERNSE